jgi:hypothetical protein
MVNNTVTRRRKAQPPKILVARPLTREDLVHLNAPRAPHRVAAFRESHHRLARLVASGLRTEQVLEISGYSYNRLSVLKQDPAFKELISQYQAQGNAKLAEIVDETEATAVSNLRRMEKMVEEHLEQADAEGELIPLKTLSSLISDRMDRFGYSKRTVNLNLNATLAAKLETAIKRTTEAKQIEGRANSLPVIDSPRTVAVPESLPSVADQSRASRGAALRLARAAARSET